MKKGLYLTCIAIVTVVCMIVGICIHGGFNIPFIGRNFSGSDGSNSKELEAFTEINLDAEVMSVTVKEGEDYHIQYDYSKVAEPSYEIENGTLCIKQKEKGFSLFRMGNRRCSMEITVPKGTELKFVKMDTDVGDLNINEIQTESGDLYSDVGNIRLKGTKIGKATIETDTGNVDLEQCSFTELQVKNDVGNTKISTDTNVKNYDVDLKTDLGKVRVNGQSQGTEYHSSGDEAGRISVEGDVGDVTLIYE